MAEQNKSKLKNLWFGTQDIPSLIPGVLLAVVLMVIAMFLTDFVGSRLDFKKNPLSPILVAIVLGLVVSNVFTVPALCRAGITFGLKKLLRLGIILLGIRLSIFAILEIGALAVGLVVVCIVSALAITMFLAGKIGVTEKLGTLIAAGTSICGVSAIIATAPAIDAEDEETAYAVATITIFGLMATIFYPYLTELVLHLPVGGAGFFLGTSVNDTSQVAATAFIYDQLWEHKTAAGFTGGDIAITTKLVRNTFMMLVIPFLGFWYARKNAVKTAGGPKFQVVKYIPLFVIGYLVMAVVRSVGDGIFEDTQSAESWIYCWKLVKTSAGYVIATSVACIGLNTDIKKLIKLGLKPFVCGLIAALSVGAVSYALVTIFGDYLRF